MSLNTSKIIQSIEKKFIKDNIPDLQVGDSVKISVLIQEGNKERIQMSEGVIISINNNGIRKTITTRKILHNIGVERIYSIHSPRITDISISRRAKVRRGKLYYLRNRSGKATRLKQKFERK